MPNDVEVKAKNEKKKCWKRQCHGSAIGIVVGYAYGHNAQNSSQFIALGLAIGVAIGSVVDFWNRPKYMNHIYFRSSHTPSSQHHSME
jgi:uncharacterized membrane protein HdeD (DUF308 family)